MLDKEQKLMKIMNIDLGAMGLPGYTNWSPYMGQMNNPWTWGQGFHFPKHLSSWQGWTSFWSETRWHTHANS